MEVDFDKKPTGDNLNIDGVIFVDADMMTLYGYKIANTTLVPLYVSMFHFFTKTLGICMWSC